MEIDLVATTILTAAILAAVPLMLAATGEAIGERAGVLNLGIEGTMLLAGFGAFRVTLSTGSLALGLLAGLAVGLIVGVSFGLVVAVARADQVLVGIGLTLAGTGLSTFLFREAFGSEQPLLAVGGGRPFDALADRVPVVGPVLLGQPWFVYLAVVLVLLADVVLRRTTFGLRVRAVGAAPFAVDAAGLDVAAIRVATTTIAGALSGLAGASLVLVQLGFFRPGITVGVGFIAVAIAILGGLTPWRIAIAALLFGVLAGLSPGLQVARVPVSVEFLQLLPYLGVVLALLLARHRLPLPAALGRPYRRGAVRNDV
ncbi:MAG: Putative deoxyribose-specific ABC transporter, permease protein [uncultured Thermomicrobiales bacterium]|uniref:Deoxyribose-specific ABC transporter, permease protein n=1 Tax=uncultured Thermomicrobiales bacterium TaxID=1645740 RepID=A0A6J4VGV2_9BACT|nr:MAG: Putative deoxyribose-specific ABC transporter, permease protein [uncultured Thermomicrobiales bacterium]